MCRELHYLYFPGKVAEGGFEYHIGVAGGGGAPCFARTLDVAGGSILRVSDFGGVGEGEFVRFGVYEDGFLGAVGIGELHLILLAGEELRACEQFAAYGKLLHFAAAVFVHRRRRGCGYGFCLGAGKLCVYVYPAAYAVAFKRYFIVRESAQHIIEIGQYVITFYRFGIDGHVLRARLGRVESFDSYYAGGIDVVVQFAVDVRIGIALRISRLPQRKTPDCSRAFFNIWSTCMENFIFPKLWTVYRPLYFPYRSILPRIRRSFRSLRRRNSRPFRELCAIRIPP